MIENNQFDGILDLPSVLMARSEELHRWIYDKDRKLGSNPEEAWHEVRLEQMNDKWAAARQRADTLRAILHCRSEIREAGWLAHKWNAAEDFDDIHDGVLKERFGIDVNEEGTDGGVV